MGDSVGSPMGSLCLYGISNGAPMGTQWGLQWGLYGISNGAPMDLLYGVSSGDSMASPIGSQWVPHCDSMGSQWGSNGARIGLGGGYAVGQLIALLIAPQPHKCPPGYPLKTPIASYPPSLLPSAPQVPPLPPLTPPGDPNGPPKRLPITPSPPSTP